MLSTYSSIGAKVGQSLPLSSFGEGSWIIPVRVVTGSPPRRTKDTPIWSTAVLTLIIHVHLSDRVSTFKLFYSGNILQNKQTNKKDSSSGYSILQNASEVVHLHGMLLSPGEQVPLLRRMYQPRLTYNMKTSTKLPCHTSFYLPYLSLSRKTLLMLPVVPAIICGSHHL